MIPSSPNFLSSFDPALQLHSELNDTALPPSESFSDDIEAIHLHRREQTQNRVVIQHRAWDLSDVFRSEDETNPGLKSLVQYDCTAGPNQRDFRDSNQTLSCNASSESVDTEARF